MSTRTVFRKSARRRRRRKPMRPTKSCVPFFGIIMIIVYVGMGVLLLINFFNWGGDWALDSLCRWLCAGLSMAFGVNYRQVKGID